jgi:Transposase DDE domain group 1
VTSSAGSRGILDNEELRAADASDLVGRAQTLGASGWQRWCARWTPSRSRRAAVAEFTGLLDLSGWPTGMRVIARKERPHPGAQLRITDVDGMRVTAFATNTRPGGPGTQLADLELRHRGRARAEDRIRCAKDTGLTNLPLHDFDQNRIWCAIVAWPASSPRGGRPSPWPGTRARRWEPKRLRLRLFSAASRLAVSGRRVVLDLAHTNHWGGLIVAMLARLRALPTPGG